ncbi:MAG TPA: pyridoxal phosphate-dependent aminotransferase [Terriglobales bacterium]|jgi:aspartate aminotransferase|nr:pyridoxal phosphate-dependent aminotransferase [Terriglobales bacterium]
MRPLASRMAVMSGEGALSVYARAKELEREGRSIIHLELGEPDFHPSASVNQALKRAVDEGKDRYCAVAGVLPLREAIANYLQDTRSLKVSSANIVIAPGCKIALFMAMMALVDPGDEVLYPDPGFPGYPSIALGLGGVPVPFTLSERNHFQPDPDEIAAKITSRTKCLIANSPGNPTGTVYTDEVQRRLAELAVENDLLVLSDEIYARIIYGGQYISLMNYPGMEERTLIIDGFSKSFAMTGWRLGYAVAPPRIVPALQMLAVNSYTCVAEFSQYGAIEALQDREGSTPRMVREFTKRRQQFIRNLNRVSGFRCLQPEGAFYAWVNIAETGFSADELCRIMLEEAGVAAIPGAAFGNAGTDFIRFSFASSTATLQEAVGRILRVSATWQRTVAAQ